MRWHGKIIVNTEKVRMFKWGDRGPYKDSVLSVATRKTTTILGYTIIRLNLETGTVTVYSGALHRCGHTEERVARS
jgi:hypothetical protein